MKRSRFPARKCLKHRTYAVPRRFLEKQLERVPQNLPFNPGLPSAAAAAVYVARAEETSQSEAETPWK